MVTLLDTTAGDFEFGADDVWTMFHSYAFDFSVWELWGTVLRRSLRHRRPRRGPRHRPVRRFLAAEGVTSLSQTPSAFYQLIDARRRNRVDLRLRYVVFRRRGTEFRTRAALVRRIPRRRCAPGEHVRHHRDHGSRQLPRTRLRLGVGRRRLVHRAPAGVAGNSHPRRSAATGSGWCSG